MNSLRSSGSKVRQAGFTVVELIIVVVVIGILAGIVTFSYRGVTERSVNAQLVSDLTNAAEQLELDYLSGKRYPAASPAVAGGKGFTVSEGTNLVYQPSGDQQSYCLQASSVRSGTKSYKVTQDDRLIEGECPLVNAPGAPTIPDSLPIVNGTTASLTWSAISGATSYEVQKKLASSSTWDAAITKTTTSHSYGALSTNQFHNFRVRALSSGGASSWSAVVSRAVIPAPTLQYMNWFDCQTHGYEAYELQITTASNALAPYYRLTAENTTEGNPNSSGGIMSMSYGGQDSSPGNRYVWGIGPKGEVSTKTALPDSEYCYS